MKAVTPEKATHLALPVAHFHVHQRESNDCGPYCVAMVSNALYEVPLVKAAALAEALNERGFPQRIPGWATLPWGIVAALRRLGLRARWRVGASLTQVRANLCQERVMIVIIGEPLRFVRGVWRGWSHYKILVAWDPEHGLGFVDPAASHVGGMTWQSLDEFRRQWAWMGQQMIEVWRATTSP